MMVLDDQVFSGLWALGPGFWALSSMVADDPEAETKDPEPKKLDD